MQNQKCNSYRDLPIGLLELPQLSEGFLGMGSEEFLRAGREVSGLSLARSLLRCKLVKHPASMW